ncbi:MAG: DUF1559 domain-containing protein [Pirellulales bacterium]
MPISRKSAPDLDVAGQAPAVSPPAAVIARPLADTQVPLEPPLDANARARRTVDNLTRIGEAFEAHLKDKGVYPARAIFDPSNKPLLSWRVELLPYLGYRDLYTRFRLDEPWNSRHNHSLLAQIPSVYQSAERFDDKTNYLLPVENSTIFSRNRGVPPVTIEDGPRNTVFVVEADDLLAVPWTEPRDYELNRSAPAKQLGALRGDSFFVVWGSGEVGRVLSNTPIALLRAMYTYDGGEDFVAGKVDKPLFPPTPAVHTSQGINPDAPTTVQESSGAPAVHPQPSADPALSALAATYLEHSAGELAGGNESEASEWFYAAALVGPPGGSWTGQYQWVPALRRPTPSVRFGIGLQYAGPRASELRDSGTSDSAGSSLRGQSGAWSKITTKYGDELVRILTSHCERQRGDESPRVVRRGPTRASLLDASPGVWLSPGVYFLAAAREGVLREAARREGVDVLVLVDWREVGSHWTARISLEDVARNQTLVELPRLDSGQIEKSRTDPLVDNPLAAAVRKLTDYLEEQLSVQPLPAKIEPRHVAGRLAMLTAAKDDNPLRALAEARFYRERGLADDTQLLLAYQSLIGGQAGSELMLGDATAKVRALKPWLPPPPEPTTARRLSRAAADDDGD